MPREGCSSMLAAGHAIIAARAEDAQLVSMLASPRCHDGSNVKDEAIRPKYVALLDAYDRRKNLCNAFNLELDVDRLMHCFEQRHKLWRYALLEHHLP